jgi:hypothetical protein
VAGEAVTRGTDDWEWPDALDAVTAAPAHHVVLLENDQVRVLEARVEAGETVPLHTHRWPGVQYFLSLADFVRRDARGEVVVDSRATQRPDTRPLVLWAQPAPPHTLENVGDKPIHAIVVESKPSPDRAP